MDIPKLEGIVQAIDQESKTPYPSHINLARLVNIFFREIVNDFKLKPTPQEITPEVIETQTVAVEIPVSEEIRKKSSKTLKRTK